MENCWDKCANRMHYLQNWTNWNIFITKKLLFYEIHSPKSWGLEWLNRPQDFHVCSTQTGWGEITIEGEFLLPPLILKLIFSPCFNTNLFVNISQDSNSRSSNYQTIVLLLVSGLPLWLEGHLLRIWMPNIWFFWAGNFSGAQLGMAYAKMFKFLNQSFAQLRFGKSVSSKTAVAPSSSFRESETLFQNGSRAKHWFKNLNILTTDQQSLSD